MSQTFDDEIVRLKALQVLQTALPEENVDIARSIENEIYTCADICDHINYIAKIKQITFDLYKNPDLLRHVSSVRELISLPTEYTRKGTSVDKWYKRQEHELKSIQKIKKQIQIYEETETKRLMSDEILKCRKCGNTNINVIQRQIRSADEPVTSFCTCTKCIPPTKWVM